MSDEYYVELDHAGTNKFVSYLSHPLKFPPNEYEVALTGFDFQLEELKKFGDTEDDGKVIVQIGGSIARHGIDKTSNEINTWFNDANQYFTVKALPIRFLMMYNPKKRLVIDKLDDRILSITKELAAALGFEINEFSKAGYHIGKYDPSDELFDKLPSEQLIWIQFTRPPALTEVNFLTKVHHRNLKRHQQKLKIYLVYKRHQQNLERQLRQRRH